MNGQEIANLVLGIIFSAVGLALLVLVAWGLAWMSRRSDKSKKFFRVMNNTDPNVELAEMLPIPYNPKEDMTDVFLSQYDENGYFNTVHNSHHQSVKGHSKASASSKQEPIEQAE